GGWGGRASTAPGAAANTMRDMLPLPALLLRLADELDLRVGHQLAVHLAVPRPPHERVGVHELVDVGGAAGAPVGQHARRGDRPALAVALPVAFAEAALRVEHPGADQVVQRVPADALADLQRLLPGALHPVIH